MAGEMGGAMNQLYLVGGGARSGKSRKGEVLALQLGERPIYLASAQAYDQEMEERIQQHRLDRCRVARLASRPDRRTRAVLARGERRDGA